MPRKASLVRQHLENISRASAGEIPGLCAYVHFDTVKACTHYNALYRRGQLHYVGLTGDFRSRLKQHLENYHEKSWHRFTAYLIIGDRHLRELECLIPGS